MAFDQSGPRWLGISDLIAEPEGPTFISYKVARSRLDRLRFVTQDPSATLRRIRRDHGSPTRVLQLDIFLELYQRRWSNPEAQYESTFETCRPALAMSAVRGIPKNLLRLSSSDPSRLRPPDKKFPPSDFYFFLERASVFQSE